MIKNKTINVKIIFKTYLKILKIFIFSNKFLFIQLYKTVFKNYFLKLFLKIIIK